MRRHFLTQCCWGSELCWTPLHRRPSLGVSIPTARSIPHWHLVHPPGFYSIIHHQLILFVLSRGSPNKNGEVFVYHWDMIVTGHNLLFTLVHHQQNIHNTPTPTTHNIPQQQHSTWETGQQDISILLVLKLRENTAMGSYYQIVPIYQSQTKYQWGMVHTQSSAYISSLSAFMCDPLGTAELSARCSSHHPINSSLKTISELNNTVQNKDWRD